MNIPKEVKIGGVAVIAVSLMIWGFNYLKGKNILKQTNIYYGVYHNIEGLAETAPVLLKGYKVGQVDEIYFNTQYAPDRLIVKFSVEDRIMIPKGSVANIFSSDLLGTKAVKLLLSESDEYLESGDTLVAAVETDLKEQVSIQMLPLKNKAEDLMVEMQEALEVVRYVFNENTQKNLRKSFESIKNTIANLENTTSNLDTLLNEEKKQLAGIFRNVEAITANIRDNNEALSMAIQNISNISDSLAKANLNQTMRNAEKVFLQTGEIMEKINQGEGSIGMLVNNDTLYYNLQSTSKELDKLILDIRNNPGKYLNFSVFGGKDKSKEK